MKKKTGKNLKLLKFQFLRVAVANSQAQTNNCVDCIQTNADREEGRGGAEECSAAVNTLTKPQPRNSLAHKARERKKGE